MHPKSLAMLGCVLLAGHALADFTNEPDPYGAGYGFDTPSEASWGGWDRLTLNTIYAEWDTFDDASYIGMRTAAPDLGSYGVSDAYAGWNAGTSKAGSGNLYSFSVIEEFSFNLTPDSTASGPVRAVLQIEGWGMDIDLATVLLNGAAPTQGTLTYHDPDYPSSYGDVDLKQRLFYWDLASAPSSYQFTFASAEPSLSLAQVVVDIGYTAPVPEAESIVLVCAGLGVLGLVSLIDHRQRKMT